MVAFGESLKARGVLKAYDSLGPTAKGVRVAVRNGKRSLIDGPFAEAKEIVGGWALMETKDKAEAIEWTKRFLTIAGDGETRIRQVFGPED